MCTYGVELGWVFLYCLCVQNLSVVLAHIQVLVVVLGEEDLLLVVSQLQVGGIVHLLLGHFFSSLHLLFTSLLLLLQLLRGLLWFPR